MFNSVAYLNGRWLSSGQLAIPIEDLGFVLGVTVVERLRTFGGKLFRVEAHLERLRRSLEIVGWPAETLCKHADEILARWLMHNLPSIAAGDDWYVVMLVTPGKTADAKTPTLCVYGEPLPFGRWADQFRKGLPAAVVDVRQVPNSSWPAELKCRSRMHFYLADCEAQAKFPGARAILLDADGHVAEASTANVIAYDADRGLLAPRPENVLPGVSQQVLWELADGLKIPHMETDMTPDELAAMDEVYLTGTSICLLPVVELDGRPIGKGKSGPIFSQLLDAWSERAGVDIAGQAEQLARRE